MTLSEVDVAHLLKRTEFFASPTKVAELVKLGSIAEAVEVILNRNIAQKPGWPQPEGFYDLHNWADSNTAWEYVHAARRGWTDRMAFGAAPLREKMALFLHGHFCSSNEAISDHHIILNQNQLFRDYAFGDFQELTQKVSIDPMMLIYLNNEMNTKTNPNENFGRELLELFTLGLDNFGLIPGQTNVYTQEDVYSASVAWQGHGLNGNIDAFHPHATYQFRPANHSGATVKFLGKTYAFDGPDIVNHIFTTNPYREISARFIAKKLWSYFAYPDPDKALITSIISACNNALNFTELLRAILNHPEFYSAKTKGGLISQPVEFHARFLAVTGSRSNSDIANWSMWRLAEAGQDLFNPPNVSGWRANEYWLSTSQMGARGVIANMSYYTDAATNAFVPIDALSPEQTVIAAGKKLGLYELSAETKANLTSYVASQRNGAHNPQSRSRALFHLLIMSPDFQLS